MPTCYSTLMPIGALSYQAAASALSQQSTRPVPVVRIPQQRNPAPVAGVAGLDTRTAYHAGESSSASRSTSPGTTTSSVSTATDDASPSPITGSMREARAISAVVVLQWRVVLAMAAVAQDIPAEKREECEQMSRSDDDIVRDYIVRATMAAAGRAMSEAGSNVAPEDPQETEASPTTVAASSGLMPPSPVPQTAQSEASSIPEPPLPVESVEDLYLIDDPSLYALENDPQSSTDPEGAVEIDDTTTSTAQDLAAPLCIYTDLDTMKTVHEAAAAQLREDLGLVANSLEAAFDVDTPILAAGRNTPSQSTAFLRSAPEEMHGETSSLPAPAATTTRTSCKRSRSFRVSSEGAPSAAPRPSKRQRTKKTNKAVPALPASSPPQPSTSALPMTEPVYALPDPAMVSMADYWYQNLGAPMAYFQLPPTYGAMYAPSEGI